ncbi:MAG: hypothetical protein EKK41_12555 [Hyphomicrobiales bacterium]|nr:MAG: hypothetical protein EKK41_12555 [Hyphomicrobiales bacterium]
MSEVQAVPSAELPPGRPVLISILCVVGFLGLPMTVWLIVSGAAAGVAPWYPLLLGVSGIVGLVCLVGLWMMRKWAVYAYAAFAVINQLILLATGLWSPLALIIPTVFIALMFIYLPRMR